MLSRIIIFSTLLISLISCQEKEIAIFEKIDENKPMKFYFISSQIMGPNLNKKETDFQLKNQSFFIDNPEAIKIMKQTWAFPVSEAFDNFSADYYLTYTENNIYRGKVSIDLLNKIAISGYGPTTFDYKRITELQKYIKPLRTKFLEFHDLKEARIFYKAIEKKNWILPSSNDSEYYKWLDFTGETIIQINNKKFARDKDLKKAFKKYMPLRFPKEKYDYNIFRFTPQNSNVRICSNIDLSDKFPEDFHIIIPWEKYNRIIIPLVNYDSKELDNILKNKQISNYKEIDKIE